MTTKRLRNGDTVNFTYDALNRLTQQTFASGKSQPVYWGYDLLNRTLYARTGSASGPGPSYVYDALGRVTSTTQNGRTLSYAYDAASNRTALTWPDTGSNALTVSYLYDPLNDVTKVEENGATSGPGLLATYAYDGLGRRTAIARAGGSGLATAYQYGSNGLLSQLTQSLAGSAATTFNFTYNTAGQILTRQDTNGGYTARPAALSSTYATNGLNQYASASGVEQTYSGADSAALSYDALGRVQTETATGSATTFLYDGNQLVGEYGVNGSILNRYVMGPGVDEPLTWYSGAGTSSRAWYAADNAGSVIATADQSGNSTATYDYGPYGEPITSAGVPAWGGSRYRYTGQIEIPGARVYYYKARVYDPSMGRFMQTDPIGYRDGQNWYAYTHINPINGSDPSGFDDPSTEDPDDGTSGGGDSGAYIVTVNPSSDSPAQCDGGDVDCVIVQAPSCSQNAACYSPGVSPFTNTPGGATQNDGPTTVAELVVTGRPPNNKPPPQNTQLPGITVVANKMSEEDQERASEQDEAICRKLKTARCWASANERRGARAAGRPLPPLVTWRNAGTTSPSMVNGNRVTGGAVLLLGGGALVCVLAEPCGGAAAAALGLGALIGAGAQ